MTSLEPPSTELQQQAQQEAKFVVHKFGGTSVGDSSCFARVADIITKLHDPRVAVVVSAMGGKPKVTDLLIQLLELAKQNKQDQLEETVQRLQTKHNQVVYQLLPFEIAEALAKAIRKDLKRLSQLLRAISIMRAYNENVVEFVSGHGELWSARILTEVLNQHAQKNHQEHRFVFVDAREVLYVDTEQDEKNPTVQYEMTTRKLQEYLDKMATSLHLKKPITHLVITGFICSTLEGVMTTLKRDGSDFTASIFGRVLHAQDITIWTDVSGVLSADPRRVPESKILDEISYQEAMELAYFGAKVIHPKTMNPAIHENIPIYIRNTFEPQHPGTKIYHRNDALSLPTSIKCHDTKAQLQARKIVSGFSTIDDLALFNVEGSGMVGVHGTSSRLFGALDRIKVNVVLIAQASSEHSICFAVPMHHAEITKAALDEVFYKEIHQGLIDKTECIAPISVIAAVGDNMRDTPGVCARFFQAMGHAGINVLAISQGSSERNISAVVKYEDSAKALRAIHSAFFLSDQTISIGIVGLSATSASFGVGKELLAQFTTQMAYLKRRFGVDLRLRAIATNNDKMLLDDSQTGIELGSIQLEQETRLQDFDGTKFLAHVRMDHLPQWLIIDVSNKRQFAEEYYDQWLQSNVHVISSNLAVSSVSYPRYQSILSRTFDRELFFDTEPCLPNGVPLLSTLQSFLQTGDQVTQIEFTCCETLYKRAAKDAANDESAPVTEERVKQLIKQQIMERYDSGCFTLQEILEQLQGVTLAKKAVLIAREMGFPAELDNIELHSLFEDLKVQDLSADCQVDDLVSLVHSDSKGIEALVQSLATTRQCPRVIATIDGLDGTIEMKVHRQLDDSHPFANLQASQSGFACYTRRHKLHPIVVTGAIPNSSMKASAVFGSILNLARNLGARDSGGHSGRRACSISKFY